MIRVATLVESFAMIRPRNMGVSIMQPFGEHKPPFSQSLAVSRDLVLGLLLCLSK